MYNDIFAHEDMLPTILAAAGVADIKERLLKGHAAGGKTFKVHLDGYNYLPYLTGQTDQAPRREIFYFSDDADLTAVRVGEWKIIFMEQRATGTMQVWAEPFVPLRLPKLFNLRRDPFEVADVTSNTYWDWVLYRTPRLFSAMAAVTQFMATFEKYPPRQKVASFTVLGLMEQYKKQFGW